MLVVVAAVQALLKLLLVRVVRVEEVQGQVVPPYLQRVLQILAVAVAVVVTKQVETQALLAVQA
jgi:hypothetical protein